ncbi:RNA-binding S4 domain-containing protein [Ekhidna sp.]
MKTFELQDYEFIELNKLLKITQLVGSGGEAKQFIDEGMVKVNDKVELQRRKKLRSGDKVEFEGSRIEIV